MKDLTQKVIAICVTIPENINSFNELDSYSLKRIWSTSYEPVKYFLVDRKFNLEWNLGVRRIPKIRECARNHTKPQVAILLDYLPPSAYVVIRSYSEFRL